ncbi:MAG: DUF3631 domain-containing protein [Dermatophilus congolensis]|nr:DUF3631 domain-containing protein [Dermatophilus congolensis]
MNSADLPLGGADILDRVSHALTRYVVLPSPDALIAVTLWIAATHAAPAWHCAPRLVIRAPEKRCGKSRLLDLVEALSHKPLMTTNASPSAVYRSIGANPDDPPTLLIDEADTIFGPRAGDNEDLRGLLNAGHQRNRPTIRYDAASRTVDRIETFALAALAGIGRMPDTIEDRAVVIRMRRRAPGETVAPYRVRRDRPHLDQLRAELHTWIRANLDTLENAAPSMPVEDRAADTWEPLTAVADLAEGDWPDLARTAVLTLTTEHANADATSDPTRLLIDARTAFGDADVLPTAQLLARLCADDEAPWATYGPTGLTPRRLGMLLAEFGITSANVRLPTGQCKAFKRADFLDAWARYCPEPAQDALDIDAPGPVPNRPTRPIAGQPWDESNPWDGSSRPAPTHLLLADAPPRRERHPARRPAANDF